MATTITWPADKAAEAIKAEAEQRRLARKGRQAIQRIKVKRSGSRTKHQRSAHAAMTRR